MNTNRETHTVAKAAKAKIETVHVECVDCNAVYDQELRGQEISCCGQCGGDQIEVTNVYAEGRTTYFDANGNATEVL